MLFTFITCSGEQVRMVDDDIPLAQFAVAFEGAAWTDPDSIALMVMQAMLGSWNKSAGGGKHMGYSCLSFFFLLHNIPTSYNSMAELIFCVK